MGIVRNQSIKNSISFYIGMAIGAINIILIYPNVFKEQPEHWGLLSILVAYATAISAFSDATSRSQKALQFSRFSSRCRKHYYINADLTIFYSF